MTDTATRARARRVRERLETAIDPALVRLTIPEAAALLGRDRKSAWRLLTARDAELGGVILQDVSRPGGSRRRRVTTIAGLRLAVAMSHGEAAVTELQDRVSKLELDMRRAFAVLDVHREALAAVGARK